MEGGGGADKKRFVCLLFAYRPFFVCYLLIDFFFSFSFVLSLFGGKLDISLPFVFWLI